MQVPPRLNRDRLTLIAAFVAPLLLTAILAPFRTSFANTDVALALIVVVVAVAANGYRLAGILAAFSSAVWFDFFLTQPYARFSISGRTDVETTILLIVIGGAVTEIAVWGRGQHEMASRRAGYLDGIRSAAAAVAAGKSSSDVAEQVCDWLVQVLSLRGCRFQQGVARLGAPLRLHHDGRITSGDRVWDPEAKGLPEGSEIELLVESGGLLRGRFLMTPTRNTRPTLEQRLIAVAFADQVGTALETSFGTRP